MQEATYFGFFSIRRMSIRNATTSFVISAYPPLTWLQPLCQFSWNFISGILTKVSTLLFRLKLEKTTDNLHGFLLTVYDLSPSFILVIYIECVLCEVSCEDKNLWRGLALPCEVKLRRKNSWALSNESNQQSTSILPTCLLTYLFTYLLTYFLNYLLTFLLTYLLS